MRQEAQRQGDWMEAEDNIDIDYKILSSVSKNEAGISQEDMMLVLGPWMQKFEELKQEFEASAGQEQNQQQQTSGQDIENQASATK